jgi:hypothetical protein
MSILLRVLVTVTHTITCVGSCYLRLSGKLHTSSAFAIIRLWVFILYNLENNYFICRGIRKIAISDHRLRHVRKSTCPHGRSRLPLDGFSSNLVFDYFFFKSVEKIQVSFKSDKDNGYCT